MTNLEAATANEPSGERAELLWRPRSGLSGFVRRKPLGAIGGVFLTLAVFWAAFAPAIAPYDYNVTSLASRLEGPSTEHLFGTDELGRDLFSRVTYGARVSITIAASAVVAATLVSLLIGGLTGYFGGWYDLIFLRVIDAWLALPGLVIAVLLISLFGQSVTTIVVVLGLGGGIQQSRVVRAAVLEIRGRPYVESARAVGASEMRMMLRHILPNIMPILIVLATTALGGFVLAEAGLSFLGYGVPPPRPTWGGMLTGSATQNMINNPWIVVWPGLALAMTVYSANMFGDALRDVLDPRLRGSR